MYPEKYTIPDKILREVKLELNANIEHENFGFNKTETAHRNKVPEGWIRYGLSVADFQYSHDSSLNVQELASIATIAACNGYTRNICTWNKAGISVIVAPTGNLKEPLSERIAKGKALVKPALEGLKGIDSIFSVISVFHDTQHKDYERCILQQTDDGKVSTTSCASDHIHLVLIYNPKLCKDPRHSRWFSNFKSHLQTQCEQTFGYQSTICALSITRSLGAGIRYLYLSHKHLLLEYNYQGLQFVRGQKMGWTDIHEEYFSLAEKQKVYMTIQSRRASSPAPTAEKMSEEESGAKKPKLDRSEILQVLGEVCIDYGIREETDLIRRVLPTMAMLSDDRYDKLKTFVTQYYRVVVQELMPLAMDLAHNEIHLMTLNDFGKRYIALYGINERKGGMIQHASLYKSCYLFKEYCEKALHMKPEEVTTIINNWFNRGQSDKKQNTVAMISGSSCGKTWFIRPLEIVCPVHANVPKDADADRFRFQELSRSRWGLFNEARIDDENVDCVKSVYEGSAVQVPVKHKNRTTVQSVPKVHLSNHQIDRNLTDGADIQAMNNRCVFLNPSKVESLVNCPNLHPAIFSHYIEPSDEMSATIEGKESTIDDIQIIDNSRPDLDGCIQKLVDTNRLCWKQVAPDEQVEYGEAEARQYVYDFILSSFPITANQEGSNQYCHDMRIRLGIESVLSDIESPLQSPLLSKADEEAEISMSASLYADHDGSNYSEEPQEA